MELLHDISKRYRDSGSHLRASTGPGCIAGPGGLPAGSPDISHRARPAAVEAVRNGTVSAASASAGAPPVAVFAALVYKAAGLSRRRSSAGLHLRRGGAAGDDGGGARHSRLGDSA